jgi:hypothetical protein
MVGRTAGVVALRDGLYTACQAYANDVIGKDAYSLILSQYGNLLVALAGGGGGATAAAADASKAAAPAAATPSGGAGSGSGAATPAKASTSSAAPAEDVQVALMQQQALQAMLVACISETDPTVERGDGNQLLKTHCPDFLKAFGGAIPALLKPATASQGGGKGK